MTTSRDEEDRGLEEKYLEHEVLPAFWCLSAVSCMAVVSKTTLSAGHATCAAAMHCSYSVHCSPDGSPDVISVCKFLVNCTGNRRGMPFASQGFETHTTAEMDVSGMSDGSDL